MMESIYVAGKVTGLIFEEAAAKFEQTEKMLLKRGWQTVINPIKLINNPTEEWHCAMEKCLNALKDCQAIYMMPCSVDSPGAQLELQYAMDNDLLIYYEMENVE